MRGMRRRPAGGALQQVGKRGRGACLVWAMKQRPVGGALQQVGGGKGGLSCVGHKAVSQRSVGAGCVGPDAGELSKGE